MKRPTTNDAAMPSSTSNGENSVMLSRKLDLKISLKVIAFTSDFLQITFVLPLLFYPNFLQAPYLEKACCRIVPHCSKSRTISGKNASSSPAASARHSCSVSGAESFRQSSLCLIFFSSMTCPRSSLYHRTRHFSRSATPLIFSRSALSSGLSK